MPTILLRFTIVMFTLSCAALADAQEGDWYVAPSLVFTNDDADRVIDDSLAGGQISIGRDLTKHLSVEGLLGSSSISGYCVPGSCWPDQDHLDISANLLAYYDRDRVVAPYLLLGVGYLGVDADEGPQYSGNTGTDNNPTASVGFGLKWRLGQSNFSVRAEHRWRTAFDWDDLTDQLTSIGVQYDLGGLNAGFGAPGSITDTGGARHWYVAPSLVFTNDDADRVIDDSLAGGQISIGRDLTKHLSVEGLLGYSAISGYCVPGSCWPDQDHLDISANLLAYYDRDRVVAPYLLLGVGYLGVDADEGPQYAGNTGTDNNPTASVGFGLKWRLGQSNFSVRAEHRWRTAFDYENLTDQLTTLGVQYDLGGLNAGFGAPGSITDTGARHWYVAPSLVFTNDDADRVIDDSLAGGQISIGRDLTRHLSVEGLLGYSAISGYCEPGSCWPDQDHLDISANLLAYYDRDRVVAPYLLLGVGYLGVDADEGPQYAGNTGTDNNPTASVGFGLKWRLGQSNFSVRAEHRWRTAFDYENLTDQLTTLGVQYDLGGLNAGFGAPGPGTGTGGTNPWYVAPSLVFTNDDGARNIDDSLAGGQISIGRDLTKHLSVEGLLGYSSISGYCEPGSCWPDQDHLDISANLLAYYDRDRVVAPYLLLGVGYLGVDADEGPQYAGNTGTDNNPTASVGVGLKWRLGQSNFSVRAEHRWRTAFDYENLTDQLTTIGVQYDLGGLNAGIGSPEPGTGTGGASPWYVAPSLVFTNDDGARNIDDSLAGGQISIGRDLTKHLSAEGLLGYSAISGYCEPGSCWPDQDHLDISANLLAYYDRDRVVAPYLLLGVGYLGVDADEGPQYAGNTGTDNNPTASVGFGLKWRLGQSNFSVRAEHRLRTAFDDENLTDQLTTIGVQYNFGGSRQVIALPEPDKDTDGDGVPDLRDACPNTKPGVKVNSYGCELKTIDPDTGGDRVFDNDKDGDRVFDNVDECPNTPPGVPVNKRGCSLDSDMDGVTTDKDYCPASRAGAVVDEFGCEADDDRDGVVNQRDSCPGTPRGARVNINGC